jgi:ATP-dependent DNA ligase
MPEWLEPMAATLTQERFAGPDWLFERTFDGIRLLDLRRRLDAIEIATAPFTLRLRSGPALRLRSGQAKAIGLPRLRAHWATPQIVVQVAFIEWTVHGKLRHPRLIGVGVDKPARDVVRERR